jgi:hypothetical protein
VVGNTYEYRITGYFPTEDLTDRVYGFHTVPAQTQLPADFRIDDLRLRLAAPVQVEYAPGTPTDGLLHSARRGIQLPPPQPSWWLVPWLENFSLVLDLPRPITTLELELAPGHQLQAWSGSPWGIFSGPLPVPAGTRVQLTLPQPSLQVRLAGVGFLLAVRIPSGSSGVHALSTTLPPVLLQDTPRVPPPARASIRNMQVIAPPAPIDNQMSAPPPPRPELGLQVRWRPPLQSGVTFWPTQSAAAPPTDAAAYQIEHRSLTLLPDLPPLFVAALAKWIAPPIPAALGEIAKMSLTPPQQLALTLAVQASDLDQLLAALTLNAAAWEPLLGDDNRMTGDRDQTVHPRQVSPGVDLAALFPEVPQRSSDGGLDLYWRDIFERAGQELHIAPGSFHQYRVRSLDAIDRPSTTWRETNVIRLEKHTPPPPPVSPDPPTNAPTSPLSGEPRATGVRAKAIVRDQPDLTAQDLTDLGSHSNVIVLEWGWYDPQRGADAWASEFRVYSAPPLDSVDGALLSFATTGTGTYSATLQLTRPVPADAAKGLRLNAGYPFLIETHQGGATTITATLSTRVPLASGQLPTPAKGPIRFPLRFAPHLQRPPAWSTRFETQPITAANRYRSVIPDLLTLTAAHPIDAVWVGVSAADGESYVADQLAGGGRAGNESAIVPVMVQGRYWSQPQFKGWEPPLADVPTVMTPEPRGAPVRFLLDLAPYLGGLGLAPSDWIRPERASADRIFDAYEATPDGRIIARVVEPRDPSEQDQEVKFAADADQSAVLAALHATRSDALTDRHLVFLAGSHPFRARFFETIGQGPVPFAPFVETLPAKSGRWVYRVHLADAAGHISDGDAVAKLLVRVPVRPSVAPERVGSEVKRAADHGPFSVVPPPAPDQLWLRLPDDADLGHLILFQRTLDPKSSGPSDPGELLRLPNSRDLYLAGDGLRLRFADGTLLSPMAQIDLTKDPSVVRTTSASGAALVELPIALIAAAPGDRVQVWACALSRDALPSPMGGPWTQTVPLKAPAPPDLKATIAAGQLQLTWHWPDPNALYPVAIERDEGSGFHRVSRIVDVQEQTLGSGQLMLEPPAAKASYRLHVITSGKQPDAYSNTIAADKTGVA